MHIFPVLSPFLWIVSLAVCEAADQPVIDAINAESPSDRIVVLRTPQGNRVGTRGTELNTGDYVKTGPRATVRILYPDGSKLIVGKASEVQVGGNTSGTEWTSLESGEVRGVIKKPPHHETTATVSSGAASSRHHFAIRSRSAVMGVRGTDFFFSVDEAAGNAKVLTIEGTVEVSKSEGELASGQGVAVQKGQYVTAGQNGVSAPLDFDTNTYLNQVQVESPGMLKVSDPSLDVPTPSGISLGTPRLSLPFPQPAVPEAKSGDIQPLVTEFPSTPSASSQVFSFRLLTFQVAGVYVKPEKIMEMKTGMVSWNPVLDLPIPFFTFAIRGHLGAMPLDRFFAWEAGALLSVKVPVLPLLVEGGAGRSGWSSGRSLAGKLLMANVALKLSNRGFLERIYVGVSHFDQSGSESGFRVGRNPVTNFKAGIGVQF